LDFYAHSVTIPTITTDNSTQKMAFSNMKTLGFKYSNWNRYDMTPDDVISYYSEMIANREKLPFEIDGMVIKVDRNDLKTKMGQTSHAPRWAVAWKFPAVERTTVVEGIDCQVGRSGALTPVARLKPVHVGGTTVSNVTLHNEDQIKRLDIRVGDTVFVRRAGDVIPEITKVSLSLRPETAVPFAMPLECPVCLRPVMRKEGEAVTYCTNRTCPAQLKAWIKHFVSKDVYDIDGFGGKLADQLVESGLVNHPLDILELSIEQLMTLDRMGTKKATKLINNIREKQEISFDRFLMGLNIPLLGHTVSGLLAENFENIDALIKATPDEISAIEGIGEGIAANVVKGLYEITHSAWEDNMDRWLADITIRNPEKTVSVETTGSLDGIFVVTGKLSEPRSKIHDLIIANGGQVASSITKKVNFLVCGEKAGSKKDKALKLGITCITEDDLRSWCRTA